MGVILMLWYGLLSCVCSMKESERKVFMFGSRVTNEHEMMMMKKG